MGPEADLISEEECKDILRSLRDKRVSFLLHVNCDIDAFASAVALGEYIPDHEIITPDTVSHAVKRISASVGMEVTKRSSSSETDHTIVLDSSSMLQIEGYDLPRERVLVIDHHATVGDWGGRPVFSRKETSCSEVVYHLLTSLGHEPGEEATRLLIAGALADTGKFRFATDATFLMLAQAMSGAEVTMDSVLALLEDEGNADVSRTIATLKGLNRARYERVNDRIVAYTRVGSFEAAVCRALIICGADVALVLNSKKANKVRISGRARAEMVRKGFSLASMFQTIGKDAGLEGGGHDGAAGLNGVGDGGRFLSICVSEAVERISRL